MSQPAPKPTIERPTELIYALDERPPATRCLLVAIQHLAVVCPTLVLIAIVAGVAGLSAGDTREAMARGLIAVGLMTALQAWRGRWLGSGFLLPPVITATYLPACLAAVAHGGLPLVAGMVILGGFLQMLFSRGVRHFRKIFPAVVSGVILIAVAMELCRIGLGVVFDPMLLTEHEFKDVGAVALITLLVIVGLGVWSRGLPKLLCALVGIVAGYIAAGFLGIFTRSDLTHIAQAPAFALPSFSGLSYSFSIEVLILFTVAALANSLRCIGVLNTCEQINNPAAQRTDVPRVQAGVLTDGLGILSCGLLGTVPGAASPSLVGVQKATGVTSRIIGWYIAGMAILLACLPSLTTLLVHMPKPVMGAALFFNGAMMFVAGIQVATSRPLTLRSTMVLGFAVMLGLGVIVFPDFFRHTPGIIHQMTNSPISISVITAILLNLLFMIGRWNTRNLSLNGTDHETDYRSFMTSLAKSWKIPAAEALRIRQVMEEVLKLIEPNVRDNSSIRVRAGSDDFDVSITLEFEGSLPQLSTQRPVTGDLVEEQSFAAGLSGYLSNIAADSINTSAQGEHCTVNLLFKT